MSEFIEVTVTVKSPPEEFSDIVTAYMAEFPFDVFEHDGHFVRAFGAAVNFSETDLADLAMSIGEYSEGAPAVRLIPKENWNELWETHYFEPVTVAGRARLRAAFQEPDPETEYDIVIQPKMSFGTGHHSTTQLMMTLMLEQEKTFHNAVVLDMGAGTGVLAVLAEKLGAGHADAVDIEEWAAENIEENTALNHCTHIHAFHGDAGFLTHTDKIYDIILANIHKQVLLADSHSYAEHLKSGGWLYISGFYEEDASDMTKHISQLGFAEESRMVLNQWCAMLFKKQ